jgi:hypothetical protein
MWERTQLSCTTSWPWARSGSIPSVSLKSNLIKLGFCIHSENFVISPHNYMGSCDDQKKNLCLEIGDGGGGFPIDKRFNFLGV